MKIVWLNFGTLNVLWRLNYFKGKHFVRAVCHRKIENLGSSDVEESGYLGNTVADLPPCSHLTTRCQDDIELKKLNLNQNLNL